MPEEASSDRRPATGKRELARSERDLKIEIGKWKFEGGGGLLPALLKT
jgi:hypothetical protein